MGEDDTLVGEIIEHHLDKVEAHNIPAIAKALKVGIPAVADAVRIITDMEPRPGRQYTGNEPVYITPDVYVYKVAGKYVTVLNDDGLSKLKVSSAYRRALKNGEAGAAKEYIQEKLRSAQWLIRSIHQRQRTIHKVTESIVKFQKDFLDHGIGHLKPLILRDVAEDIGMHESTVSRVTTNKYVHTPQGIYELKFFFNSAITRTGGGDLASEAVKSKIKKIVAEEDPKKPLSDQQIVALLKEQGITIARRTVAKYRDQLGILPSSKRRRLY
jgi:RNA polymerase sigma-54 factor